jgi:hypothetical protein
VQQPAQPAQQQPVQQQPAKQQSYATAAAARPAAQATAPLLVQQPQHQLASLPAQGAPDLLLSARGQRFAVELPADVEPALARGYATAAIAVSRAYTAINAVDATLLQSTPPFPLAFHDPKWCAGAGADAIRRLCVQR